MPLELLIAILIVFVLCIFGYICGQLASNKDYSFGKWFLFGFFLFPFALYRAIHLPEPDYFTLKRTEPAKPDPTLESTRLRSENYLGKEIDLSAPLDITGYDLYEREDHSRFVTLWLRTHVGKTVTSLLLSVTEEDENGTVLVPERVVPFSELLLAPASKPADPLTLELSSKHTYRVSFWVKEVFFEDHSSLVNEAPHWVHYSIEHPQMVEESMAMKDFTPYAQCYPTVYDWGWRCICGQANAEEHRTCTWCGLERNTVFTACTPERLAPRITALREEQAARAVRQKEAFDAKTAKEQEEIQKSQHQVAMRRQRFFQMVQRRKKRIIAVVCTLILLFVGISGGYKWYDCSVHSNLADRYLQANQSEQAHDAWVHAGKQQDAGSIEEAFTPLHAVNTDQSHWTLHTPDAVASVPEGAFICDVVDDQVFYRQTSDGMDKTIWQKTIGQDDDRELFTYDEKAVTYVYIDGCFGVLQRNRVGNSTLLLVDLDTQKTVRYNFSSKAVALSKTKNNELLLYFEGATWKENYYLVERNFYGQWMSRRITQNSYQDYEEEIWYDCSVLDE